MTDSPGRHDAGARPPTPVPVAARWTIEPTLARPAEPGRPHAGRPHAGGTAGDAPIDGRVPGGRAVRDIDGAVVATVAGGNPLATDWRPPEAWEGDLVIWSGTLAEDLTEVHPHTWMGPGRDRLATRVDELLPRVRERGGRLLLRGHARQVLSDPPSIRAFLAGRAEDPVGLLLEPAALFEASMLGAEAEDHLERILGGLGDLTSVLLLTDARTTEAGPEPADDPEPCLHLVGPGTGLLPWDAMERAVGRWVDAAVPRAVRAEHAIPPGGTGPGSGSM